MNTEDFFLPAHWALYLINGDATGYSDDELAQIDEWLVLNAPGPCVSMAEDTEFCWRGDDDDALGADRAVFTFHVVTECYSDGDIIAHH